MILCKEGPVSLSNVQRHILSEKLCKREKTQERINFPTSSSNSKIQESTNGLMNNEGIVNHRLSEISLSLYVLLYLISMAQLNQIKSSIHGGSCGLMS